MSRLTCIVLLALAAAPATATLVTYLEPRLVEEMETVRLIIRAEGTGQAEVPDFSPLGEDFDVLGNQTSSRISSINGRTVASVEYQLTLRPKHTGELTVPSLTIGGERTEPIRLTVRPLDPDLKDSIESMVFFETEVSANPVYVQAETVLTRRLYYSQGVQIYSDLPGVPEVEHAVVIPLGETQSRSLLRGGERYGVIEQRFALFPEKSGAVTIPAISVTSSVRVQSGGRTRRSGVRVSTEEIELEVLPIPPSYPAEAAWLPATDVTVIQRWLPHRETIDVGEPLTFELDVTASGNRGSAIPPIPLPLPPERFKIYPEAPVMEETARSGSITGRRSMRYALIPTTPGSVVVQPLTVTWWDTVADTLRETRVEVSRLLVTGTPTVSTSSLPEVADPFRTEAAQDGRSAPTAAPSWPWLVAIAVTAIMLLAGTFRLLERPGRRDRDRGPARPGSGRARWQALKTASAGGDLATFRQALAAYLADAYGLPAVDALNAFRREPDAARELDALDRAVFASREGPKPDLQALLLRARQAARRASRKNGREALPALYA